jgi:hypothetical protein
MKRKIYAGLLFGGVVFAQGLSCLGPVPQAEAIVAGQGTNVTVGAPIWNIVGGDLLTNLTTVVNNLLGTAA